VDWAELSELYRKAPLGEMSPNDLATVFSNSGFKCFVYADGELVGVGRALADGLDCSYIAGVAVLPEHRGRGLGTAIMRKLLPNSRLLQDEHGDGDMAEPRASHQRGADQRHRELNAHLDSASPLVGAFP
jgi:GNAT superfamily N-acetyltransferase